MSNEISCDDAVVTDNFAAYQGDTVHIARQLPSNSVGLNVHSPPFSSLYTYSDSALDMGNSESDAQFFEHYRFLIREAFRVMRPGRLVAVHCKNLVDYKGSAGRAGIRDFRGEIIRAYEAEGFKFHSEVTIWKCPVTEMQRTKAHGLLYKQLRSDSSFSRQGMAEYIVAFRKWAKEGEEIAPIVHTSTDFTLDEWQNFASPVWMDIDQTNVLNVKMAREDRDEKHMCPLQLDVIERVVRLWSNPGDVVWSPFMGIGSEGVGAMTCRDATGALKPRRFIGAELKASYFQNAVKNLQAAEPNAPGSQIGMFA
jgi:DNA modification methylase